VKPTEATSEMRSSAKATNMAVTTKVTTPATDTDSTGVACPNDLSQGDRCDANQAN